MKKRKRIIIFVIVITVCFVSLINYLKLPYSEVVVSGNAVDNDQNNYMCGGDLIRIDEKLYFNYKKNIYNYGLIEISENGSKRIYWDGPKWLGTADVLLRSIRNKDGRLLTYINKSVQSYSNDTGLFKKDDILNYIPNFSLEFQEVDGELIYLVSSEVSNAGPIWLYDNHETKLIIEDEVTNYYVKDGKIFYIAKKGIKAEEKVFCLIEYDINSRTENIVFELKNYFINSFVIEGDYLIFKGYNTEDKFGIYKLNIRKKYPYSESICPEKIIYGYNVFNGYVYITTNKGITKYDLISNEALTLCEKKAEECYIVDDKWVYFSDSQSNLFRVTQDGKETEKVFG